LDDKARVSGFGYLPSGRCLSVAISVMLWPVARVNRWRRQDDMENRKARKPYPSSAAAGSQVSPAPVKRHDHPKRIRTS
jgi:hypothetical protein